MKRYDIKSILKDSTLRKTLLVNSIIAIQLREGIITTVEQAEIAYNKIQGENDV